MGSYGVSEVGTRAGERVDGRVNRPGLTLRSIAESGISWDGRIMGAEASVRNKLAVVEGFVESDRGGFDQEVVARRN